MSKTQIHKEIFIAAPLVAVWKTMGDFGGMEPWFPSAQECTVTGSGVGAVRRLVMPDGGVLEEEQTEQVEGEQYTYRIVSGEVPFSDYSSRFAVKAEAAGTRVIWTAEFRPAEGAEQSAAEFVSAVYEGGLAAGKALLEAAG